MDGATRATGAGLEGRPRLERLDHLRGLAALLVLIWHAASIRTGSIYPYVSLFGEGYTGVSLFCTLSGFILAYLYFDRDISYRDFIGRRLTRILPLFTFYLVFALYSANMPFQDLIEIVTTTARYGRGFPAVISQGWTILIEIQFYLIFPFLLLFARRKGIRYLFSLLALSIGLKLCVLTTAQSVQALSYWTIFGRIDQFLSGMICGIIMQRGISRSIWWRACLPAGTAAAAAIFGFYFWFHIEGGLLAPAGPPWAADRIAWAYSPALEGICYGAVTLAYVTRRGHSRVWITRAISHGLAYLGRVSYSIYLNQFFVGVVLKATLTPVVASYFPIVVWEQSLLYVLLLQLPFIVLVSTVTYHLIERPFMELRRGRNRAALTHLAEIGRAHV